MWGIGVTEYRGQGTGAKFAEDLSRSTSAKTEVRGVAKFSPGANGYPLDTMAKTRPNSSITGPPLEPGRAAAVSCNSARPEGFRTALKIPSVTVPERPNGVPTTMTGAPTGGIWSSTAAGEARAGY